MSLGFMAICTMLHCMKDLHSGGGGMVSFTLKAAGGVWVGARAALHGLQLFRVAPKPL